MIRPGLAAALLFAAIAAEAATGEGESFLDEFEALSQERWYVSDGWSNGAWHNCTWSPRAVSLEGGRLHLDFLRLATDEREYSCAEVQTRQRYGHGTYEARLRTGAGSGLNAAFFTYVGPSDGAAHHEIDFEILMRDPSRVSLNTYADGAPAHGTTVAVPGGADAGFNDYAFVWEPDRLRWFLNGQLVHEATPADGPLPGAPQKIFLSLWGSDTFTDWMGPFEAPEGGVAMEVEWVAYTALGEACQFPGSVACSLP